MAKKEERELHKCRKKTMGLVKTLFEKTQRVKTSNEGKKNTLTLKTLHSTTNLQNKNSNEISITKDHLQRTRAFRMKKKGGE